jgi:Secretion system C-terminal sorting domain
MKKGFGYCVVVVTFFAASVVRAQIPDAGFETWVAGAPTGWVTENAPGVDTVIYQTTDAHSGTYAAEGIAKTLYTSVVAPFMSVTFPTTVRSATFSGYYKFAPVGGDTLALAAIFAKNSSPIGVGQIRVVASASSYTQFTIPITYTSASAPDSAAVAVVIERASGSTTLHAGSMFKVDDLSLNGVSAVENTANQSPMSYALNQNYPNPFNPTTVIQYQLPASSQVSLKVYDVLGREVATLVDTKQSAGIYSVTFDGNNLASGVYFYRLQAGGFSDMKKLTLLK